MSLDACGNVSPTVTNTFDYLVGVPLTIQTNGHGTTSSKTLPGSPVFYNEQPVVITALPDDPKAPAGALNLFSNWVVLSNGNPIASSPIAKNYTFTMQSNLTLVANFVTNLFIDAAGSYNGLYSDTNNGVSFESAGMASFKTTSKRTFSGKVYVQGIKVGIAGTFDLVGKATLKAQPPNMDVEFAVDLGAGGGNKITGTVSNTVTTAVSSIYAVKAYDKLHLPPVNLENTYTMVLPGTPGGGAVLPAGDGFMVLTVVPATGAGKLVEGTMGDGAKAKIVSVGLGLDGTYPLYAPLYKDSGGIYHGMAMGWVSFTPTNVYCPDISWIKEAVGALTPNTYPGGFSNINLTAVITTNSLYTTGLAMGRATMTLSEGGLALPIYTTNFTYTAGAFLPDNAKTNKAQNAIVIKADGKGGAKAGFYTVLGDKTSAVKGGGGVLQDAGVGGQVHGYFVSHDGTQTGSIFIRQWQLGD